MLWLALVLAIALPFQSFGAFGLTTATDYYTVDTGAGLVFKVRRVEEAGANANTISIGDIRSLVYNGVEYQDTARGSQINSGFDNLGYTNNNVSVTAEVVNVNYIKVTVTTANLVHYYIARNGYPHIYMATYFDVQPVTGGGLCRYIARLPYSGLPNGPPPSDLTGTTTTVESGDVFGLPNGETRAKHYSNQRLLDWFYTGATGNGVGVFMLRDSQEGGSGGPFFRCLINQGGGDQEIYDIINYGEGQTEAFRTGILDGPYALVFNNGQPPTTPLDYAWLETAGLNLTNWIPAGSRGVVTGTATGVPAGFQTVVGFANATAQYWAIATNGSYTTPRMIPGTYTATLYKQEYAVATASVTVNAGATNTLNLASSEANPAFIFKLGEWDGTPAGFLNASKMTYMHPTDVRMASWATTDFTVETNPTAQFPSIQARAVNGLLAVHFNLNAAQAAATHTVRIGITTAYISGRPKISVNSWVSANPAAPNEPSTRTFTVGTYRANNVLYTYSVPASAFVTGENILYINPISGSSDLGGWLSAGYVFDCVQMDGPPIAPLAPVNVAAALNAAKVSLSWTPVFNAASYKIKRATTRGGPYTTVATNVVANFDDTNTVAATRYYYIVTSANSVGESANSAEVVAGVNPALTAYLPFDENTGTNATDATGNGWNGSLLNGASWNTGKYASGANLNGTSNYVSLPAGIVSALNDFTIAAWVNQTSVNTWARVFDFGSDTVSYMMLTPANGGSGVIRFAITIASTGGEQQINGVSALPTGWHHVAVTLQGSVGILYVDGVAAGTNSAMTLKPSSLNLTTQNYIGKSQWPDPYLNGRVDDFRIYNGALSAAQISALVSSPPFAPTNLTGTAISAGQINLNWNAVSGATDYNVLRATTSGGPYTTVAAGVTATNYSDTGLSGSTTYYYVVAAVDTTGAKINSTPTAVATPAGPVVPTLLAYLKFDESGGVNAADATGHGWNGTPAGTPAWVGGYSNNAVNLSSASSQYVALPVGVVSSLNDCTIATWVKQTTASAWARIFDFGTGQTANMFLTPQNGANNFIRFGITTNGGGGEQQITGTAALPTGIWKHVAVTLSGSNGVLYVDGVPVGTNSAMTLKPSSLGNTTLNNIGKSQYADPYLNAQVDEFRIYSGALSAGEVATLVTPLAAPTGLTAVAGDGQATLSWNAVVNASSYQVLRSLTSGGPYAPIAVVTNPGYTDAALLNGTNYFYGVKAANTVGQSAASAQVSVRPVSTTPPAYGVILNGGNLTLFWPADHTGWRLEAQTNSLGTNWQPVFGSGTANLWQIPIDPANLGVFFRLVYP